MNISQLINRLHVVLGIHFVVDKLDHGSGGLETLECGWEIKIVRASEGYNALQIHVGDLHKSSMVCNCAST